MVEQFPMDFDLIEKMLTATDKSSDEESTSNYCKPCLRDKMYEQASVYCCECSEILCSDCKKHHSKNKLTTTYTVVDMNGDPPETRKLNYVKNLTKCTKHQLEEVKYICKDHDQLCCNECAILTHRKCQSLQSINDCIASGFEKRHLENMEPMEKHVENMKLHEEKHKKRVCESETLIKHQLLRIKSEFDNAFIDFEKKILKEVRTKCTNSRHSISSQQSRIYSFEAPI
ncbi:transcription intermediary factor 1-beta-like [Ruditapes philippinarum]|uniref:transcription intermediary factor 1-beta-like n=1 Tax=Ruditapes philippinarum TaxID=129788 RepID=UPI00295AED89|nr:transcription intermediary factor 1-beta-like [Ruditapes philippinarum]